MKSAIPDKVEELRDRMETWRRECQKKEPMPLPLWSEVIEVVKRVGVNRTGRALGMNSTRIQGRFQGAAVLTYEGW